VTLARRVVTVPAAGRTLAIFEAFASQGKPMSKLDLARHLGIPESSCADLLNTLVELGFLSKLYTGRRYYPTRRLHDIMLEVATHDPLGSFADEIVRWIHERTNETTNAGVLDGREIKIIATMEGGLPLRYRAYVGDKYGAHSTALGKALLAELGSSDLNKLLREAPLPRSATRTKISARSLERELEVHRGLGWFQAIDEGESGISSVAVAAAFGGSAFGLSIAGPSHRIEENKARYIAALNDARAKITASPVGLAAGDIKS
jgi:DNA-binding IclR family transcriptional regulator